MKLRTLFLIQGVMAGVVLSLVNPGLSQGLKQSTVLLVGTLERISPDSTFIVVNKQNILISSDTKVVDEQGKGLSLKDLKPKAHVDVEVLNEKKARAKKITLSKPRMR